MKIRSFFPLGKAYGQAFCNRTIETKTLIGNIENGKHTFLVAPRRYGKSSLCDHAFEQVKMPRSIVDFHIALKEKDVEHLIINGVTDLIGKSVGSVEKLMQFIKRQTKRLQPKFTLSTEDLNTNMSMKLELAISADSSGSHAENVAEALLILEKVLREKNKQAVLLFDEFQEIGLMKNGRSMEGAIRHAAQETKNLAIIFCGSNPHLLRTMFEDDRRPLYKLCRKLILNRMEVVHYQKHLNHIAQTIWNTPLNQDIFDHIMHLTERHPYYVNYLCDIIFSDQDTLPTLENIQKAWKQVIEEEKSDLLKDFFSLTHNQRCVMKHIAQYGGLNLYSSETARKMDVSVNSISRAIETLSEKDYIEKIDNQHRLIAPVYRLLLSE